MPSSSARRLDFANSVDKGTIATLSSGRTKNAQRRESARQVNERVEELVRMCPSQYLWGYNRYKQPAGAPPPPTGAS